MRRIIAFVIALTMILSMSVISVSAAETLDLSISLIAPTNETIEAGNTVQIPVQVSDRLGLRGVTFTIKWNPEYLTMSNVKTEEEDEDTGDVIISYEAFTDQSSMYNSLFNVTTDYIKNGELIVAGSKAGTKPFTSSSANFLLGNLNFTVKEAAAGQTVKVEFVETTEVGGVSVLATSGNDGTSDKAFAAMNGVSFNVAGGEADPVADNGLMTDASQKLQITEPKMTSNGYAIDKALIFASSINATNDASEYGTAILREGFGEFKADNEFLFKVKAENTYDVDTDTKGFLGAISSIREGNYGKTFSAKAYMIVDGEMYFANETAENVYNAQ